MLRFHTVCLALASSSLLSAAPDYFPLAAGNQWTYRNAATGDTFRVDVFIPFVTSGRTYNHVTGYGARRLALRRAENGYLYSLNEETGQETLVATFEPVPGGWYDTNIGGCDQGAQPQPDSLEYRTPQGIVADALTVVYRDYSCAASGFAQEIYAGNIGLLRRTVNTPYGPQVWELVHARVGPLTFTVDPNTAFRVSLDASTVERAAGGDSKLRVSIRISIRNAPALDLRLAGPHAYDIAVRDDSGSIVYRWSETAPPTPNPPVLKFDRETEFVQEISLRRRGGEALPDGNYVLEAWLNTPNREFAGATRFEIVSRFLARPAPSRAAIERHASR